MRPPASGKRRSAYIAGRAWRDARLTNWTQRLLKKGVTTDEDGIGPLLCKICEGRVDLEAGASVEDSDLQPHGATSVFRASQCGLGISIGRIDQNGHTSRSGYQFTQEFKPLCSQLSIEKIDACQIAARPGEARDQTNPDRIFGGEEHDRDRRGCLLGRLRRRNGSGRDDQTSIASMCVLRRCGSQRSARMIWLVSRADGLQQDPSRLPKQCAR